jgi:hypothetical protein
VKLGLVVNTGRLLFDFGFGLYFFQCSVSVKLEFDHFPPLWKFVIHHLAV